MKVYLLLKENNIISGWSYTRLDQTVEVEVDNPEVIKVGIDSYEDGKIVSKEVPAEVTKRLRILELKKNLLETDYLCWKHADGDLTDEEYAETKAQRHAWRLEINELEGE